MPRKKSGTRAREPLQVYFDAEERALLDRVAAETGLSRAEVLRRGLRSFAAEQSGRSPMLEFLDSMTSLVSPADMAERHDEYLSQAYLDRPERKP